MSLTDFLGLPDVRDCFDREFKKPSVSLASTTFLQSPSPARASLVGTAFDYVFRIYIELVDPRAKSTTWIAERAVKKMDQIVTFGGPGAVRNHPIATRKDVECADEIIKTASDC